MCESAHGNSLPPTPLCGISTVAGLLAGRQDAAAGTAKLPSLPNRVAHAGPARPARVRGA